MSDRLLLSTRKGLLEFRRVQGEWVLDEVSFSGNPVEYATVDPRDGSTWASLDHGHWGPKLHHRPAGGVWAEVPAPKYPTGDLVTVYGTDTRPAKLENIWVIEPGPADRPGQVWLGTNPGGLFRRAEEGAPFELVKGLWAHPSRPKWFGGGRDTPGIHSICVDPRNSEHVLVALSCAGTFESTDGGGSWTPRNKGVAAPFLPGPTPEVGQDPHIMVRSSASAEVLWQQNHHGVFRTTDNAQSWTEVGDAEQGVVFGFALATSAASADTAWVVPARSDDERTLGEEGLRVFRTEDGGGSWTSVSKGLPKPAWDLVYRHALAIDGDTLCFGSTTGNVYLSTDGGEGWQSLGTNFPPVYAVRFA